MPTHTKKKSKPSSGLAAQVRRSKQSAAPVWQGPCDNGPQGGITSSLLSRYLVCGERFRVHAVEGLRVPERFSAPLEFGNMWHTCEESLAEGEAWESRLRLFCQSLCMKYPLHQEEISLWYEKCQAMFPLYVKHWSEHPDVVERTPLLQEQKFDVPYKLPAGRTVRLRGKWDAVDLIGKGNDAGVYLQENKTKSSIDGGKIAQQLSFDLQTMLYVVALTEVRGEVFDKNIMGVRYNVVRRSAHKSVESTLEKIEKDQKDGRTGEWFARWKVEVHATDIERFRRQCLDPVLENLCDDYECWAYCYQSKNSPGPDLGKGDPFNSGYRYTFFPEHRRRHFILPYGVYNVIAEGGTGDIDEYIRTGSSVGLQRVDNLFPEL